jgi:hypothetical protein
MQGLATPDRTELVAGQQIGGNLSAWLEQKTLGRLVLNVTRAINESDLRPVAPAAAGLAFRPRTLLALVTYCYANAIYGSEDIEAAMREDATFRRMCGDEFPDWRKVRHFRRQNRAVIHHCLVETFRRILGQRASDPTAVPSVPLPERSRCGAMPADGLSDQQLSDEANERIERAMIMDTMASDD